MSKKSKVAVLSSLFMVLSLLVILLNHDAIRAQATGFYLQPAATEEPSPPKTTTDTPSSTGPVVVVSDGRIDTGGPIAVYADAKYPVQIYTINPATSEGFLELRLTQEEIADAGVPTPNTGFVIIAMTTNRWIGTKIVVYRLFTGEFQVNTYDETGKLFETIWK